MPETTMNTLWLQFGVAGILGLFALQVIREILTYLGHRPSEAGHSYTVVRKALVDGLQPLSATVQEIRGDTEKLRASQHRANEISQAAVGKLDLAHVKLDTLVRHAEKP